MKHTHTQRQCHGGQHRRHMKQLGNPSAALSTAGIRDLTAMHLHLHQQAPLHSRPGRPILISPPSRIFCLHPPIEPYRHMVVRIPPHLSEARIVCTEANETESWATAVEHHSTPYLTRNGRHEHNQEVEIVHAPLVWRQIGRLFDWINFWLRGWWLREKRQNVIISQFHADSI